MSRWRNRCRVLLFCLVPKLPHEAHICSVPSRAIASALGKHTFFLDFLGSLKLEAQSSTFVSVHFTQSWSLCVSKYNIAPHFSFNSFHGL